jgi:hypothetical protein
MSMDPEPNDFHDLRRLLTLKRYEQPPPGYFDRFSTQVIARIEAGETVAASSWLDRLHLELPWLRSVWTSFETKPVFAGALGAAVCGLLAAGFLFSDSGAPGSIAVMPVPDAGPAVMAAASRPLVNQALVRGAESPFLNGAASLPGQSRSLFENVRHPQAQLVNDLRFPGRVN